MNATLEEKAADAQKCLVLKMPSVDLAGALRGYINTQARYMELQAPAWQASRKRLTIFTEGEDPLDHGRLNALLEEWIEDVWQEGTVRADINVFAAQHYQKQNLAWDKHVGIPYPAHWAVSTVQPEDSRTAGREFSLQVGGRTVALTLFNISQGPLIERWATVRFWLTDDPDTAVEFDVPWQQALRSLHAWRASAS